MSRVTTVGISEGDFAELMFRHINDLVVWSRMTLVSKRFNQVSKKIITVTKEESTKLRYKNYTIKFANKYSANVSWYDDNLIRSVYYYLNGAFHGLCKEWYSNGQIMYKRNYIKDKKHGLCKEWYDDGLIMYKRNYVNDEGISYVQSGRGEVNKSS